MRDHEGRTLICYEVDPALNPKFPAALDKRDCNNGVNDNYTKVALNLSSMVRKYSRDIGYLPRMIWVDKRFTLKQLHYHVFEYLRPVLGEWLDWKDPNTTKNPK